MALEDIPRRTNAEIPGGVQGGVLESIKTAVMVALREALNGTSLDDVGTSNVAVEMEYPMEPTSYPGIWVQFSFTEFVNAGVGHELLRKNEDTDSWEVIREFQFKGTVSLTIVALTNLERDRLSDSVVTMLMYARAPQYIITDPNIDTKQFRTFITALSDNPYCALSVNHDSLTPGGQSMTPGVPWDEELPGYEDTYSFDILGQSNIVFSNDGTYSLRAFDVEAEKFPRPGRFDWT